MKYLQSGTLCGVGGYIYDCVRGGQIPIEDVAYRKDGYLWSSAEMYHINHYNAAVTDEFLQHVLSVETE